jgi:hypothetical protein
VIDRAVSRETTPWCGDDVLSILARGGYEPTRSGRLIRHYEGGSREEILDDEMVDLLGAAYDVDEIRAALSLIASEEP